MSDPGPVRFADWWLARVAMAPMALGRGRPLGMRLGLLCLYIAWFLLLLPVTGAIVVVAIVAAALEMMNE